MFGNWNEEMLLVRSKNENLLNEMKKIQMRKKSSTSKIYHGHALSIFIMENLGKAFSTLGDSIQSHYQFEPQKERKMKKVS